MQYAEGNRAGWMIQTYFDNASTSYPKPPEMVAALARFYNEPVGSYGRDAAPATLQAGMQIELLRENLAERLGIAQPDHLCFADNATTGLNTILLGMDWLPGDVVYVSPLEHNAVMRPLYFLGKHYGVQCVQMPHHADGRVDLDRLVGALPLRTRLVVVNMECNVNGLIQPIEEICALLRAERAIPILLDTTQWLVAGKIIEADLLGIDYLAFTGHKGLLGPTGTGGFFVREPLTVHPLKYGGTGRQSEEMPPSSHMPERYAAGTVNSLGLVALSAAVTYGPRGYTLSQADFCTFLHQVATLPGVQVFRAERESDQGYLASIIHERVDPATMADSLREGYGIICRNGLHCAPRAHGTLGTLERGTLRLSISPYHSAVDLDYFLSSLAHVLKQ